MKNSFIKIMVIFIFLVLVSCTPQSTLPQTQTITSTQTPSLTPSPSPSPTPSPISSPTPTSTPIQTVAPSPIQQPTITPTPTPTPASLLVPTNPYLATLFPSISALPDNSVIACPEQYTEWLQARLAIYGITNVRLVTIRPDYYSEALKKRVVQAVFFESNTISSVTELIGQYGLLPLTPPRQR